MNQTQPARKKVGGRHKASALDASVCTLSARVSFRTFYAWRQAAVAGNVSVARLLADRKPEGFEPADLHPA